MNKIIFCKKCLYSNLHPLGLTFDEKGVCSGCNFHNEKNTLDWSKRLTDIEKLVKPYRSKKNNYDCIVPVTGSNDSYYTLHVVKNVLKLHPLVVSYNNYFNTPLGIKNLSNLRIKFDVDIIFRNTNPLSVKKIVKTTLRKIGSVYWHSIAGQTVLPVQTAVNYKIPLIFWGAHEGMEQVGMFSHLNNIEMTRRYRKDHHLMGFEAEDLISHDDTLSEDEIFQYIYPSDEKINSIGIRGLYLGNYFRWDPKKQHEQMIKRYDYKTSNFNRTFDNYDYTSCYVYMDLHDKIKLYKHGFSKVTDHACREIRHQRISRNEALKLVKKYELKNIKFLKLFCNWLGINEDGINFALNQFRNKKHWKETSPNTWKFKGLSTLMKLEKNDKKIRKYEFINNSSLNLGQNDNYVTFGKGFDNQ